MRVHVETADVAERDKLSMWIDLVCAYLIQVDCHAVIDHASFHGAVAKLSLPRLDIAQIKASGQTVMRTREQISRAQEEHFILNIQRRGTSLLCQDQREVILEAGDCALYSSVRPYTLRFNSEFEQTVLILPESLLRALNRDIDSCCNTRIAADQPTNKLLLGIVDGLYNSDGKLPGPLTAIAVELLTQVLTVASDPDTHTTQRPELARHHVARIKEFALQQLSDPALSAQSIAAALRMSLSHLHRLFTDETETLMAWVWKQRLEACRRDLADSGQFALSISEIAFRWGFNDCAHFSRSFRNRYGSSPREWRHHAKLSQRHRADLSRNDGCEL